MICVKPFHDELWHGWLLRLMECNGFASIKELRTQYLQGRREGIATGGKTRLDYVRGLDRICTMYNAVRSFPETEFALRRMTVTYALFPMMSYGHQAMRSQVILRDEDGLYDMKLNSDIQKLRLCPKCMEEDLEKEGVRYFHTWHHIENTSVCAIHGVPLLHAYVRGQRKGELNQMQLIADIEAEMRVARFAKELYDSTPFIELKDTQRIIREQMQELGFSNNLYAELQQRLKDSGFAPFYKDVFGNKGRCFKGPWVNKTNMLGALAFLFPNPEDFFLKAAKTNSGFQDEFFLKIQNKFIIRSPIGQTVELECVVCHKRFHIHPYAVLLGCGCPDCEVDMTAEEVIKRQLACVGDGKYELIGKFSGYGDRHAKIRHEKCGKIREMRLADIVWEEKECACMTKKGLGEMQGQVDKAVSGFLVLGHGRKIKGNCQVKIQHELCGREFEMILSNFLKSPYCRKCHDTKYSPKRFREDMTDLTGDEYEIVQSFVDQHTKVTLRHKLCGTCTTALPSAFLNGRRCELCSGAVRKEELKKFVYECTGGMYEVISSEKNTFTVQGSDGTTIQKESRFIMQELMRPTPSRIFKKIEQKPDIKMRTEAAVYIFAKEKYGEQESFSCMDIKQHMHFDRISVSNAVKWLVKNGYIKHVSYGKYLIKSS